MAAIDRGWWPNEIAPPWLYTTAHFVLTGRAMDIHQPIGFGGTFRDIGVEPIPLDGFAVADSLATVQLPR